MSPAHGLTVVSVGIQLQNWQREKEDLGTRAGENRQPVSAGLVLTNELGNGVLAFCCHRGNPVLQNDIKPWLLTDCHIGVTAIGLT